MLLLKSVTLFLLFNLFTCKVNSPQVKRNLKSSKTNFVYELSHEISNDLRFEILENMERKRKSQLDGEPVSPSKINF